MRSTCLSIVYFVKRSRFVFFRYFEVGLRVCDIVVNKFTFAISSPDEFLFAFIGKTTPYSKIFKILFRKFSLPHWSTLLCWKFVKFIWREICEIVRYLPDKQTKISAASQAVVTRYCADRDQNLPRPVPNNVCAHSAPDFIQIGSLSSELRYGTIR